MKLPPLKFSLNRDELGLIAGVDEVGRGPLAGHVGFDGVAQAMSGAAWFSGDPDRPARAAVPYTDYLAATNAAFGILIALIDRGKTGKGQVVEGSLLGAALTTAGGHIMEQAVLGANRQPTGNRSQAAAPPMCFALGTAGSSSRWSGMRCLHGWQWCSARRSGRTTNGS